MTEPRAFSFADDGTIPNSPLPLLVYRQAVPADAVTGANGPLTRLWTVRKQDSPQRRREP